MFRILLCAIVLASTAAGAAPRNKPEPIPTLKLPAVGDQLAVNGVEGWPSLLWLYDPPSMKDSAGKVVVHWFCARKMTGCTDDLARLITLKENTPNVYVIAYVNGSKYDAKKIDPIRGSEGVGRGTVAFGPPATKLFKSLGIKEPVSIVVGVDNKVQQVTTGIQPADLDTRDAKIQALVNGIKLYTVSVDGPKTVKEGQSFQLSLTIVLADWLVYSKQSGTKLEFRATVPPDIKCDHTSLSGDQLKPVNQTMSARITCSGPHGSYEAAGQIQFAYDTPGGATGIGADGAKWKFQISK